MRVRALMAVLAGMWTGVAAVVPTAASAEDQQKGSWTDKFFDPDDGNVDLSNWLLNYHGFLPMPVIITEPAIGYGGGISMLFFSDSIANKAAEAKENGGHITPPDVYGGAFIATENGTRGGAVFGKLSFLDDRWRYRGGVGDVRANLDFYGVGGDLPGPIDKVGFTLSGWASMQNVLYRLFDTNTFISARWLYMDFDTEFKTVNDQDLPKGKEASAISSGLGVGVEYDSRDNTFTPNKGWTGAIDLTFYDKAFGSDTNMQSYRGHVWSYFPLAETLVLGLRGDLRMARGDVPFYQQPFIDMRGISAGRFQDENAAMIEGELRWNFAKRWAAIGFMGDGRAWGTDDSFGQAADVVAKGIGVRYLIARTLGIYVGADYAWGTDDTFYVQMGSAWNR